ncbi:uncharacterized protein ACHE_70732S [Aspergillus chevalieri]|uniref:Uncharacterized protein n=1 Tax=Aspergillus chevalieri TaxID=182096 RepID=A0A7R7VW54_ASPCH|nr:uncharacterized protein ACHE_70732S [Aspergillus chevalieri]BCR91889.1 hypothetical protein ACHE_70732S [Aspergillus chevalieri]
MEYKYEHHHPIDNDGNIRCCCGQPECAFLRENQLALEAVEKNLETAARLGQALLHRHESYIAEAEEDRRRLLDNIDALERERRQVQSENSRIIQENRSLVEQLDALNNTVADSDAHVNSLTIALENTEAELRTVSASAARAAELEAQLNRMEAEQSRLQESLVSAREDEKSASQRWKKADSTLRELQEQVVRLEKEAREERESHADLVQRMERQRTVERELDGAAGRLKGAATAHHQVGRQPQQTSVVSRFVRDILQDNANLQIGIMELRDMLESSNQEVQNLRDQVLSHHPLNHDDGDGEDRRPSSEAQPALGKRLSQELDGTPTRVSPEYHIHHHYHPPPSTPKKEKPKLGRRFTKKRRSLGNPALMHSARQPSVSSTSTILSQTSVSIPPSSHRWSAHSSATESLASSPYSGCHNRPTSIFDRMERGFESSQPTSPELSPMFKGVARPGKTLEPPFREDSFGRAIEDELANLDALNDHCTTVPAIPEEREDYTQENNQRPVTPDGYRRRRRGSHDSLLSVAGMDIHTPSRRRSRAGGPGPIPIAGIHRHNFPSGAEVYSTPPVIATTTVTADREAPSKNPHSPRSLLASVCRSQAQTQTQDTNSAPAADNPPSRKPSITRRVGGWVRGRWGTVPVAAPPQPGEPASQTQPPSPSPAVNALTRNQNKAKAEYVPAPAAAFRFRHPGVNQKGPIMGFRPSSHPPISVHAEVVDEGALRESLAE